MAILNSILNGQLIRPQFHAPPGVRPPIPAVDPAAAQIEAAKAQRGGGGGGMWDQFLQTNPAAAGMDRGEARPMFKDWRDLMKHGENDHGRPGGGVATAPGAVDPYGGGVMGSIMKAFNLGGQGGLDPAKLMAMLGGM